MMTSAAKPSTLFQKIWDSHIVTEEPGCPTVLYIDLHLVHEVTSPQAFQGLRERGLKVRRPGQTLATVDHSIPTEGFAETACSMVSRYIGRNRSHRIGELLRSTTGGAILATVPLLAVALAVPNWVIAAFAPSADLLAQSNASLRVVAMAMLIGIPAQMWLTAVEGTGDTAAALGIEIVLTIVMVTLTWLAAIQFGLPLALVWLAVPATG